MALTVTIASADKSQFIDWESLRVEQQVTNQVDTANFRIKKYGTKNYTPVLGDTVVIADGATDIFGGTIQRIDDTVDAGTLTHYEITCISHEHTLDRYLVSREITNKSVRYILNAIVDDFVNLVFKEIDMGESTETWTTEDGTVAADTDNGDYIEGSQSRKFTAIASSTATARRVMTLDLTTFENGSASTAADYVTLWFKVDTVANFASLRIRMGSDSAGTYTNYYEYTYNSTPRLGWNQLVVAKSAFSTVGSPSWASNLKRQYCVTASAGGTVNVQIDDIRMIQASTAFTQQNVIDADSPFLGSVKFNYEQVTDAIRQVADAVGNDWYISTDRDLYFYQPASIAAPFSLTDTSANFVWDSLQIKQDASTIKNQVFVRGGEYEGSGMNYDVIADGTTLNFRSPYRIKGLTVFVNAGAGFVQKTVGVDNLDDPASFDCLYNYQEKNLKFKATMLPANGNTVRMTGNPMIPVLVKKGDATSIATNGIYEYAIIDKSIITQQGGRDRATAELRNYRNALVEGKFTTDTTGLRAGQSIDISITARGIAETYLIQAVVFYAKSPTAFYYDVALVSTRTFGIIEYLLSLLRDERKQIIINDDEVLDLVQEIAETVTSTDVWTQGSTNAQAEAVNVAQTFDSGTDQGTVFVFAPYSHASFGDVKRAFILNGSLLG